MLVRGFSLFLLLSLLGRQVQAVPRPQGEGGQHGGQHPRPFEQPTENTERVIMATPTTAAPVAAVASPQAAQGNPIFSSTTQSSDTLPVSSFQSTTSASEASTAAPSSTRPSFTYFPSNWYAPKVFDENNPQPAQVFYQIPNMPANFDPVVFVCQTSSSDMTLLNSTNTWSVAQLRKCTSHSLAFWLV